MFQQVPQPTQDSYLTRTRGSFPRDKVTKARPIANLRFCVRVKDIVQLRSTHPIGHNGMYGNNITFLYVHQTQST